MLRRADAVIDAFLATAPGPVWRLRDEFGVTHFVVDLDLMPSCKLSYFAPFDRKISELCGRTPVESLEMQELLQSAAVLKDDRFAVSPR
jgi:hypothetical protein